jgi:dephospho-CoA kinase
VKSLLVIGLTGGIASGKSTVSKKLKEFGATIIDADLIAREVIKKNEPAWQRIKDYFGPGILLPSGEINRKALGNIIFNNAEARTFLNQVTHPEILKRCKDLINYYQGQGRDPIVLDVPLLIESGANAMVEKIWIAYCSKVTQIQRLMTRDGLNYSEALKRIEAQMPLEEKVKFADEVINTEGSLEETENQIKELWFKTFKKEN